jgi:outer membrane receptor for ferrienterochelin and colicins
VALRQVVLVALLVLSTAAPAAADVAAEARLHDELAREHFRRARYSDALREFFFEHRLAPNPRILFNIALCFDALRRPDDAFLFFNEYMAGADEDPERRRLATAAIQRLSPNVARIAVTTEPAGVEVYVDQRDHGSYGQAPRLLALPPGRHRLFFEREGYRPATVEVEAVRGQEVAASATLERIVGRVALALSADAHVAVRDLSGATVSEADARANERTELALAPGDYQVEVAADGYHASTTLVRVEPEATSEPAIQLERLPPPTGDLTITSNTSGAVIQVDGEAVGFAPTVLSTLEVGTHQVRLEHPGLMPWEGPVEVTPNERSWLTVSLVPPPETQRSPVTWAVGGVGIASLLAGIVVGGFAIATRDEASRATGPDLQSLRSTGMTLNIVADVLGVTGLVALAASVILYFATESVDDRVSEGTVARGER